MKRLLLLFGAVAVVVIGVYVARPADAGCPPGRCAGSPPPPLDISKIAPPNVGLPAPGTSAQVPAGSAAVVEPDGSVVVYAATTTTTVR